NPKTASRSPAGNGAVRRWPLTKCFSGILKGVPRPGRASSLVGMTAFLRNRAMDCTPAVLWPESVGAVGAQLKRTGRESHREERLLHVARRMAITNLAAANCGRRQWKARRWKRRGFHTTGVPKAREK